MRLEGADGKSRKQPAACSLGSGWDGEVCAGEVIRIVLENGVLVLKME